MGTEEKKVDNLELYITADNVSQTNNLCILYSLMVIYQGLI